MRLMDVNWQQTKAPLAEYPEEDRERLGRLLRERRAQLGARYRHRMTFAREVELKETLLADLENAKRATFTLETLTAVEGAYRLVPGSFKQVLEDPTLNEFPRRLGGTTHQITLSTAVRAAAAAEGVDTAALAEKLPPPPDLPEHLVGAWHRFPLAEKWLWWTPDTTDLVRAALVQVLQTMESAHARIAGGSQPDAGDGRAHRAV